MIDSTYRTVADREHRAIAGLSMGAGAGHADRADPPGHVLRRRRVQRGGQGRSEDGLRRGVRRRRGVRQEGEPACTSTPAPSASTRASTRVPRPCTRRSSKAGIKNVVFRDARGARATSGRPGGTPCTTSPRGCSKRRSESECQAPSCRATQLGTWSSKLLSSTSPDPARIRDCVNGDRPIFGHIDRCIDRRANDEAEEADDRGVRRPQELRGLPHQHHRLTRPAIGHDPLTAGPRPRDSTRRRITNLSRCGLTPVRMRRLRARESCGTVGAVKHPAANRPLPTRTRRVT